MKRKLKIRNVVPALALLVFFGASLAPAAVPLWVIAAVLGCTCVALGVTTARHRSIRHGLSFACTWLAVEVAVFADRAGTWSTIGTVAVTLALLGTYMLPQGEDKT